MAKTKQQQKRIRTRSQQRRSRRRSQQQGGGNYNVDSNVPDYMQWSNPFEYGPSPQLAAGLYTEPFNQLGNIPITPTTTEGIHYNLRSAEPPNESLVQYPGTNRLGNNYRATPGVQWYVDKNPDIRHMINCTVPAPLQGGSRKRRSRQRRNKRSQRR